MSSVKATSQLRKNREASSDRRNVKRSDEKSTSRIKKVKEEDDVPVNKTNRLLSNKNSVVTDSTRRKIVNNTKSKRPVTPPSSRVTKTKYFPSKNIYSNALKSNPKVEASSSKENLKTVKPTIKDNVISSSRASTSSTRPTIRELKQKYHATKAKVNSSQESDNSLSEHRPRTATLRRGSIVNKNIAGPDAPKSPRPIRVNPSEAPKSPIRVNTSPINNEPVVEEPDYEDDFESYESDFEEYLSSSSSSSSAGNPNIVISDISTSSENDLKPLDKPRRELGSASTDDEKKLDSGNYELPDGKHKQILDNISEAGRDHKIDNSQILLSSDEGFEDGNKSLQFINFLGAKMKYEHRKSVEKRRKRGEEILAMIKLDSCSFTLMDMRPVPYDIFIKSFGKSNTVQVAVQTGEDNENEETQTEKFTLENKWTQCPPSVSHKLPSDDPHFWDEYKCNIKGVGGDVFEEEKNSPNLSSSINLEDFLLSTGSLVLNILMEESQYQRENSNSLHTTDLPFSQGYSLCDTRKHDVLSNCKIKCINWNKGSIKRNVLMAHEAEGGEVRSFVSIWNLFDFANPESFLCVNGTVSCCIFGFENDCLVFAGLQDGTIALWDLKENLKSHVNNLRTPTFCTEIYQGHTSRVVAIISLTNSKEDGSIFYYLDKNLFEVCSLDEDGVLIVWTVVYKAKEERILNEDQGLAHWGSVLLVINLKIDLAKLHPDILDFKCTDLISNPLNSTYLYISTNYGIILHCLANGSRGQIKKMLPDETERDSINCLEICSFSAQYFLAGFQNGNIRFYSSQVDKPLISISNKEDLRGGRAIEIIQWSFHRPFIFYVVDSTNTLHVWNLKASDIFPTISVPFKEKIVALKLSGDEGEGRTYMAIATENGEVKVHHLHEDHGKQSSAALYEEDKRKLLNYINRYF